MLELVKVELLLGRGRSKSFAPLRGFGLWLRFGRLLDFFSAFVFASHTCKCATKQAMEESATVLCCIRDGKNTALYVERRRVQNGNQVKKNAAFHSPEL